MDKIEHDYFCRNQQFDSRGRCMGCDWVNAIRRNERYIIDRDVEMWSYHKGRKDAARAAIEFLAYNEVEDFGQWFDDLVDYIEYKKYIDFFTKEAFDELDG